MNSGVPMSEPSEETPPAAHIETAGRQWIWAAFGVLLLPSALGLFRTSIWVDEAYTLDVVTAPFARHWHLLLRVYDHPPLYFSVAWLVARVSESLFVLRLLSWVATVAAGTALVARIGYSRDPASRTSPFVSILFACGFALSPAILFQATNIRHYGFVLLAGVFYLLTLEKALCGARVCDPRLSAVFAGLSLLCHHFIVLLLLPMEVLALWRLRSIAPDTWRRREAERLAIVLPFLTVSGIVIVQQFPSGGELAMALMSGGRQGLREFAEVLGEFHGLAKTFDRPAWTLVASMLASGIMIGADLFIAIRRRPPSFQRLFWLVAAYAPLCLLLLLSQWKPALLARMVIVSGAAVWMAHAQTFQELGTRVRLALLPLLLGMFAMGVFLHFTTPYFPRYEEHAASILRSVRDGEALVLVPGAQQPIYEYYARREGIAMPPCIGMPIIGEPSFDSAIQSLPERLRSFRRVWVVYEFPGLWDPQSRIKSYFDEKWIPSPVYQPLWGLRWVVTYYDNPRPPLPPASITE